MCPKSGTVSWAASFGGRDQCDQPWVWGGSTTLTGHVDTVLANASYYDDIYGQSGSNIRDVAGRHLFDNGNKRTALALTEEVFSRSGTASPGRAVISDVVDQVARGDLRTVDEIAKALGG